MRRLNPVITRLNADDIAGFVPLWVESRTALGQTVEWAERAAREGRLEQAVARDGVRIYLASAGDEQLGFVVVTGSPLSGLTEDTAVWIDQLYVRPGTRKQGVGKALLAHVTRYADRIGAAHIVSFVPAKDRDSNRYLARLGFNNSISARIVSTTGLRRKVVADSIESPTVRRRRTLRARAIS